MNKIFAYIGLVLVLNSCKKEEIVLYNNQLTPDLSNPVIQKLTNTFWYNPQVIPQWESTENVPKPSEVVSSVLYTVAWKGLLLNRDGTSVMLFVPPMFDYNFIYCYGTWTVSEEEENTIIMTTKTPVSNVTAKIKITQMETKDNMSYVSLSMNMGNRVLTADLNNAYPGDMVESYKRGFDHDWLSNVSVKTDVLKETDFKGVWATAAFDGDRYYDNASPYVVTRVTYAEDILTQSPVLFKGLEFDLNENGNAKIAYADYFSNLFNYKLNVIEPGKKLYSNATWSLKGNKLTIESDEVIFYSVAEGLFGIPVHDADLITLREDTYVPFRLRPKRFFTIEVISNEQNGNWCRVTTNDAIAYLFLFKREAASSNVLNVRDFK